MGLGFAYACPEPGPLPWQWYWDSCFTAITWRHFDPDGSRRRAESLLGARRKDEVIGHTIFWNTPLPAGGGLPLPQRDLAERLDDRQHPAGGAGVGVAGIDLQATRRRYPRWLRPLRPG